MAPFASMTRTDANEARNRAAWAPMPTTWAQSTSAGPHTSRANSTLRTPALAGSPDVLLVDEPTAQLDQTTAHRVADALTALHAQGTAVVIATHDPAVRDQCDQVIDLGDERYRGGGR